MSEEFSKVQLEAALKLVQGRPGITSQELAGLVPRSPGRAGISRDRAKALLRILEDQGRVTRQSGQAQTGFYPAPEEQHAEQPRT